MAQTVTATDQQCKLFMAVTDVNQDNSMSPTEFLAWLGRLTGGTYTATDFATLPAPLQALYTTHATAANGEVDILGARPGSVATSTASGDNLTNMCAAAAAAFAAVSTGVATPAVVATTVTPATVGPVVVAATVTPATLTPATVTPATVVPATVTPGTVTPSVGGTTLTPGTITPAATIAPGTVTSLVGGTITPATLGPGTITPSVGTITPATVGPGTVTPSVGGTTLTPATITPGTTTVAPGITTVTPSVGGTSVPPGTITTPPAVTTAAPTADFRTCTLSLAVSDTDRNNVLDPAEYLVFLNRITTNRYAAIAAFEALPQPLQDNYATLQTATGWDITGASPVVPATEAQAAVLQQICDGTNQAMAPPATGTVGPTTGITTIGPSTGVTTIGPTWGTIGPTLGTIGPSTAAPTMNVQTCKMQMAISDADRNNLLSDTEFVTFINRLTANQFSTAVALQELPPSLVAVFNNFAGGNVIDITGASPAQPATEAQQLTLQSICTLVDQAIQNHNNPSSTALPTTLVPTGGNATTAPPSTTTAPTNSTTTTATPSTMGPTVDTTSCKQRMVGADTNPRDNMLNADEYFLFVNLLTDNQYAQNTFPTLPQPIFDNFYTLLDANTEQISILGANPADATDAFQLSLLDVVCSATNAAIEAADAMATTTVAPAGNITAAPAGDTPPIDTSSPILTIHSAFTVASALGLTAEVLNLPSSNRHGVDDAFKQFVSSVVPRLLLEVGGAVSSNATAAATSVPATPLPGTLLPGTASPGTALPGTLLPGTASPSVASVTTPPGLITALPSTVSPVGTAVPYGSTPAPNSTIPPTAWSSSLGNTTITAPVLPSAATTAPVLIGATTVPVLPSGATTAPVLIGATTSPVLPSAATTAPVLIGATTTPVLPSAATTAPVLTAATTSPVLTVAAATTAPVLIGATTTPVLPSAATASPVLTAATTSPVLTVAAASTSPVLTAATTSPVLTVAAATTAPVLTAATTSPVLTVAAATTSPVLAAATTSPVLTVAAATTAPVLAATTTPPLVAVQTLAPQTLAPAARRRNTESTSYLRGSVKEAQTSMLTSEQPFYRSMLRRVQVLTAAPVFATTAPVLTAATTAPVLTTATAPPIVAAATTNPALTAAPGLATTAPVLTTTPVVAATINPADPGLATTAPVLTSATTTPALTAAPGLTTAPVLTSATTAPLVTAATTMPVDPGLATTQPLLTTATTAPVLTGAPGALTTSPVLTTATTSPVLTGAPGLTTTPPALTTATTAPVLPVATVPGVGTATPSGGTVSPLGTAVPSLGATTASPGGTTAAPLGAEATPAPITRTDPATCKQQILLVDGDRNGLMNESEYIAFVNKLANNAFIQFTTLDSLPAPLQQSYSTLQQGGEIEIVGELPSQGASPDQLAFLDMMCAQTDQAIYEAQYGLVPGSAADLFPVLTSVPTVSGTAPPNVGNGTATPTVPESPGPANSSGTVGSLSIVPDSAKLVRFEDTACDTGVTALSCLTVYAEYDVTIPDGVDHFTVYDALVSKTQQAIDDGGLQAAMIVVNPSLQVNITGAAFPPYVATQAPTTTPPAPVEELTTAGKTFLGLALGSFIAILIVLVVVTCVACGCFAYVLVMLKQGDNSKTADGNGASDHPDHFDDEDQPPLGLNQDDGENDKPIENYGFQVGSTEPNPLFNTNDSDDSSEEEERPADKTQPASPAKAAFGYEIGGPGEFNVSIGEDEYSSDEESKRGDAKGGFGGGGFGSDDTGFNTNEKEENGFFTTESTGFFGGGTEEWGKPQEPSPGPQNDGFGFQPEEASEDSESESEKSEDESEKSDYESEKSDYEDEEEQVASVAASELDESEDEFDSGAEEQFDDEGEDEGSESDAGSEDSEVARIKEEIIEVVRDAAPHELDNIDIMMEQFSGREEELLQMLKVMHAKGDPEDDDDEEEGSDFESNAEDGESQSNSGSDIDEGSNFDEGESQVGGSVYDDGLDEGSEYSDEFSGQHSIDEGSDEEGEKPRGGKANRGGNDDEDSYYSSDFSGSGDYSR
ncbi:expressed unknown protein [Seminavis robusta]|uniref:EF-hand domain-containing protein n=1 Tax=Seminavis robusta TaxID=568900 RepID=A0A9N8DB05_9STRA|nr:expressed unknown protein [Seminavis robusta]|eukprot:Sro71_g039210.1 n/a (2031) ;mRNA; f:2855-9541